MARTLYTYSIDMRNYGQFAINLKQYPETMNMTDAEITVFYDNHKQDYFKNKENNQRYWFLGTADEARIFKNKVGLAFFGKMGIYEEIAFNTLELVEYRLLSTSSDATITNELFEAQTDLLLSQVQDTHTLKPKTLDTFNNLFNYMLHFYPDIYRQLEEFYRYDGEMVDNNLSDIFIQRSRNKLNVVNS